MNRKERRRAKKLSAKEAQKLADYRKRAAQLDQETAEIERELRKK